LLRDTSKDENPNPCIVSGGVEVQTSYQERARLLCHDCEQRLSKHGEQWIFRNGLKADGSFPLASFVAESVGRTWPHVPEEIYPTASIPRVNASAIAYFAASIFWRSSVYQTGTSDLQVKLGPFEEAFRVYLMGQAEFPTDAVLSVTLRAMSPVSALVQWPSKMQRFQGTHAHSFIMPGIAFNLFISRSIPPELRRLCFVRGQGNPLIFSDVLEETIKQRAGKAFRDADRNSRTVGFFVVRN
jgi:hypothetical protein